MQPTVSTRIPGDAGKPGNTVHFHATSNIHNIKLPADLQDETAAVQTLLMRIVPYEEQIMNWLAASPSNAAAFAANPIIAVQKGGIDFPQELLDEIQTLSDRLMKLSGVTK